MKMTLPRAYLLLVAGAMLWLVPATQTPARPAQPKLEARIAELKAKTAALVASARPALDAMTPQQRLAAPPAVWRVPGALAGVQGLRRLSRRWW